MNSFELVAELFKKLCISHGVPVPEISPSHDDDPCDFTSHVAVRLNVKAAGDIEPGWYTGHVFGHYLADLHEAANAGLIGVDPALCDRAADVIAELLGKEQQLEQAREVLKKIFNQGFNPLPVPTSNTIYLFLYGDAPCPE